MAKKRASKKKAARKKAAAKKVAARRVGRPTKYNAEIQAKADRYVDGAYIRRGDGVPSRAGLARYLDVDRATLANWEAEHPEFFSTLERINFEQHRTALGGGITGKLNPTICKLVLANHGYSERFSQEHTGEGGGPIVQEVRRTVVDPKNDGDAGE